MEDIQGAWLDRRTRKTVIVRDMIMDGDQLVIMSSVGSIPPDIFSNYFVRMSEEDYGTTGIQPELSGDAALAAINSGLSADEQIRKTELNTISLDKPLPTNNTKPTEQEKTPVIVEQPVSQNTNIIKKVFDKMEVEPEIAFSINIEEWPIKELKMLVNVLDIPFVEISDYIITQYLNKEVLSKCFSDYLRKALENDK